MQQLSIISDFLIADTSTRTVGEKVQFAKKYRNGPSKTDV